MRNNTCLTGGRRIGFGLFQALLLTAPAVMAEPVPGDLVLPRAEGSMSANAMPPSVFPHWIHRVNYRCDACHIRLFEMKRGATEITMKLMNEGKSCGVCHNGDKAFQIGLDSCERCHKVAEE